MKTSQFRPLQLLSGLFLATSLSFGQAPDNTKVNARDRDQSQPTADQAKNGSSDLQLMHRIRKAVTSDKSLSINAHNVKVIAQNGKVTLKGHVSTDEESKAVEAKALAVAGAGNVVKMMQPKKTKSTH
ncbi:MAG: BON domain-containing protein [Acidobacteriota bacterium]